ncbi:carbohydrate ABC transporter permease [Paenibacillus sp. IB182496]|uniref:Carbohydrate ABC transporter permease n=1 Tax=Paenibacillus sabuli TaxID=2772509 RepID=A0A927GQ73_9BACL|nr:carbohydrate ABC transporter permease [Paenibacillus sabuli]MBD2843976.1 carbohydrate ABC transporter permease [Paenibacillus sabuli]
MVKTGMVDRLVLSFIYGTLILLSLSVLFPIFYVVAVSLTPFEEVLRNGGFIVVPRAITWEAYRIFLTNDRIPDAYQVTFIITVAGTLINLVLTALLAYPLSKPRLPGRKIFLLLIVFTMLFNGGIIPTYLIVKATGLLNTLWAMMIPNAVSAFNLLIMKTFYENLPESLDEAAKIDGAGEVRTLVQIVLPLSMPIMATIGLFYSVGHWNEFFQAIMYVSDTAKFPLQVVLRGILSRSQSVEELSLEETMPTESLQMAAVILTAVPIIVVYPFIQKHFTQGVLLGSIKG